MSWKHLVVVGVCAILLLAGSIWWVLAPGAQAGNPEKPATTTTSTPGSGAAVALPPPVGTDPFLAAVEAVGAGKAGDVPVAAPTTNPVVKSIPIPGGESVVLTTEDTAKLSAALADQLGTVDEVLAAFRASINLLPADKRPPQVTIDKFERDFRSTGFAEYKAELAKNLEKSLTRDQLKVMVLEVSKYPWIKEKTMHIMVSMTQTRGTVGGKYLRAASTAGPEKLPKPSPE